MEVVAPQSGVVAVAEGNGWLVAQPGVAVAAQVPEVVVGVDDAAWHGDGRLGRRVLRGRRVFRAWARSVQTPMGETRDL
jgi:hypothetical protein